MSPTAEFKISQKCEKVIGSSIYEDATLNYTNSTQGQIQTSSEAKSLPNLMLEDRDVVKRAAKLMVLASEAVIRENLRKKAEDSIFQDDEIRKLLVLICRRLRKATIAAAKEVEREYKAFVRDVEKPD